jgi:HlyD family secretion protein
MRETGKTANDERSAAEQPVGGGPVPGLPALVPAPRPRGLRSRRLFGLAILLVALAGVGGGVSWWEAGRNGVPAGIVFGNGRIEADEIDIATKFAGRIAELYVDEGDRVTAGQKLARMDTRDLEQSLAKSEAQALQAQRAMDEARANIEQQQTATKLAAQELGRTRFLEQKGYATKELLDQRQQQLDAANAALNAANARLSMAEHAHDAAQHDVAYDRVTIADNTLVAPRDGRIQYRIANTGEVLGAGGKVFTMLDVGSVYMDIYLPTLDAGRVKVGTEARIVLDAYPDLPLPAAVSFVSSQAQFTPKTVETQTERDRLMFRIRARIDPELIRAHADAVRSGLPGITYVRLDPQAAWPAWLVAKAGQ